MKTDNNLAAKSSEARETRSEKAVRLLTTAVGDPFKLKLKEFEPFYPSICTARNNGVPRKLILKHLADAGLKLYPGLFEKLMAAMDETVSEGSEAVTCTLCRQKLPRTPPEKRAPSVCREEKESRLSEPGAERVAAGEIE